MTTADLLWRLGVADVRLAADGDDLTLDGPDDALTADVLASVTAHKPDLVDLIRRAGPRPGERCNWEGCDSARLRIVPTRSYGPEWVCAHGHSQGWEPVRVDSPARPEEPAPWDA